MYNFIFLNMYQIFVFQTFVWKALAKLQLSYIDKVPVVFDNVKFLRTTPIPENGNINYNRKFTVINYKLFSQEN